MTTNHKTRYPVWEECMDHTEPDGREDERYDCFGNSSCVAFTLAEWHTIRSGTENLGYVLCQGCTTFQAEQEEWEATHDRGTTLDDDSIVMCKARPPRHYCLECSEANEDGEWVQHEDPEEAVR